MWTQKRKFPLYIVIDIANYSNNNDNNINNIN